MKRRIIQGLLAAAMVLTQGAQADASATYLSTKPAGDYALQMSFARGLLEGCKKEGAGAVVTVDGFYRKIYNDLYNFGDFTPATGHEAIIEIKANSVAGLYPSDIVQKDTTVGAASVALSDEATTLVLAPAMNEYGAHVSYRQCLSSFVEGLWFQVSTDVVRKESGVTFTATGADVTRVSQYFTGAAVDSTSANQQALSALILGTKTAETGIADLDVKVGYTFVKEKGYQFDANLDLVVPTANTVTGKNSFEPVIGTRNFAFGGGLDGRINAWENDEKTMSVDVTLSGAYKYLFEAAQKRVVSTVDATGAANDLFQYNLVGALGDKTTQPAANVLLLDTKVTPGSNFQGLAGLSMKWNSVAFDLAYNLSYQDAETVVLKNAWADDKYAVLDATVDAKNTITAGNSVIAIESAKGSEYTVDTAAAATPSQTVHAVVGSVAYVFNKDGKMPMTVRGGGHYDFAGTTKNITPETWGVSLGFGVGF